MKVAYNSCYGGFSLSPIALTKFAEKKGIAITWYKQIGYKHQANLEYIKVEGVPENGLNLNLTSLKEDLGEHIKGTPTGLYYYPTFHDETRRDPDLIAVIEELGEKANGSFANLKIAEIPDGVEYEITEYDGLEEVVPPRMTW
jgi:hypothetical protein